MDYSDSNLLLKIPTDELKAYRKGILAVLSKVELDHCNESLKEDLKSVYKLLDQLRLPNHQPISSYANPQIHESRT